jgi:hypothetical protein
MSVDLFTAARLQEVMAQIDEIAAALRLERDLSGTARCRCSHAIERARKVLREQSAS